MWLSLDFLAQPDAGINPADVNVISKELYEDFRNHIANWGNELHPQVAIWSGAGQHIVRGSTEEERRERRRSGKKFP